MPRGAAVTNLLKSWALVAFVAVVFGGLGWLLGGATTAVLFAFCALLAAAGVYRYGDRALLGTLGARPFGREQYVQKFRTLAEWVLEETEIDRFLDLAQRLPELGPDELAGLTFTAAPGALVGVEIPSGLF